MPHPQQSGVHPETNPVRQGSEEERHCFRPESLPFVAVSRVFRQGYRAELKAVIAEGGPVQVAGKAGDVRVHRASL